MRKLVSKIYQEKKQSFFIIILCLFVIFTVIVIKFSSPEDYWFCQDGQWRKHGKPKDQMPSNICLVKNDPDNEPIAVVSNFYNWYFQSTKKEITANSVKDLGYFTPSFRRFLSTKAFIGKSSPFVCRQDEAVISFNLYQVLQKKDKSVVTVYQNYIDHQDKVDITLKLKRNVWQLDSIKCSPLLETVEKLSRSYN